jgi:hypothetical protein
MSVLPLGMFDNFRLARWVLSQGDSAQALLGYYQAFQDAESIRDRWEQGVRPAGDLIVGMVESFPTISAMAAVDKAELEGAVMAKGLDWPKYLELAEMFLPIVLDLVSRLRK